MRLKELLYFNDGGKLRGLDNDLLGFHNELYKLFPNMVVTSGRRYGNGVGKLGNKSRHNLGQAIDIKVNNDIKNFLLSNDGVNLMKKYKVGFLDESDPKTMRKTKATGPHFHIGKDSTLTGNYTTTPDYINYYPLQLPSSNNYEYPIDFNTLPVDYQEQYLENLDNQKKLQQIDENKKKMEYENLQIQSFLEQKQQEKEQMLNMIPKATFVKTERTNNYINLLNQQASQNYYRDGGNIQNEKVYQTYERITGKNWETAKKEGLTDGSYEQNIRLQQQLLKDEQNHNTVQKSPDKVKKKPVVSVGDITAEFIDDKGDNIGKYSHIFKTNGTVENVENPNYKSLLDLLKNKNTENINIRKPIAQTKPIFDFSNTPISTNSTPKRIEKKESLLNNFGEAVEENIDKALDYTSDHWDMVKNYVVRHYFDEGVQTKDNLIKPKESASNKNNNEALKKEESYLNSNNQEIYLDGDRKFVRGVFNLNDLKFAARNRGDFRPVERGSSALITSFKEFTDKPKNGSNFLYLNEQGKLDVLGSNEVKNKKGKFAPITELPLENMKFSKDGTKVKLIPSPDMNNMVIDIGDISQSKYNSGIGVGKDFGEWANIKDLNNFSFLNGAKVLFKVNNQSYLISGTGADIINAYTELSKKGKVKSFKLDNGSFNLPIKAKNKGIFDTEDLKAHQNRNTNGGHSLILID